MEDKTQVERRPDVAMRKRETQLTQGNIIRNDTQEILRDTNNL